MIGTRRFLVCGLLVVLTILATSVRPLEAQTIEQKCDQYMKAAVEVQKFQGAAAVARNGKLLFVKGYGPADVTKGIPNSDSTVFLIGSLTKQFTSTLIMQLVEQGKISLDAPLTTYLTGYPKETGDKVTIHHLLNHTSGIPSYTGMPEMALGRFSPVTLDSLIGLFKYRPLEFEPGTQWRYNNSGYVLLGAIIEKVTGRSFASTLQKEIFDKLGMKQSGYLDLAHPPSRLAAGHTLDSAENVQTTPYVDMSWPLAAGGLYSTVRDLAIWDKAMIDGTLLTRASLIKMTTPGLENYGYGLVIDSLFGRQRVAHGGDIDGFTCEYDRYPDDSLCVMVLSNSDATSVLSTTVALATIALGKPYDIPVKKVPIATDSVTLEEFVGVYGIQAGIYRVITRSGDSLFSQRTGSTLFALQPEAKDKFFFPQDHAQTLTFLRDAAGKVDRHVMRTAGQELTAKRIEGAVADSILNSLKPVTLDPAVLAEYLGQYELMPNFILEVTVKEGRTFAQATGQSQIEMFARSKDVFAIPQVGAEITFERDSSENILSLTLRQAGQVIPGRKIK